MKTSIRVEEVYSADRFRRIVILRRPDGFYQAVEEKLVSYSDGDEYNPKAVAFPVNGCAPNECIIMEGVAGGLLGTVADARREVGGLIEPR